jgi:hypothetical protein
MNHQEAVERRAAERYQLGELTPEERNEFEEHFFDCSECAAEVHAAAVFAAGARAVFSEEAGRRPAPTRSGWLNWWRPAFAFGLAAMLLLLVVYDEFLRIPGLKRELAEVAASQAYPAFFLRPVARGDDQVVTAPKGAHFLGLSLDVPPGAVYASYECELRAEPGGATIAVEAPAPVSAGAPLNILIPTSRLSTGHYVLTLRGDKRGRSAEELGRFSFILQLQ